jgi:hypothetical protein
MLVTPKTHGTGKVFDANGLEWNHLLWVDTETGKAEQIVVDCNGAKQLNADRTAVLTQEVTLPAPVLFVPFNVES